MDIQTLKYIYDVAIYGSITRAAQYNYISPSHLSRQVKKIEEMFSISIFERSYNGVSLTKQGQEFIRYIEPILKGTIALENIIVVSPLHKDCSLFVLLSTTIL